MGRSMRVSEILKIIAADEGFHYRSGGGVTIGGGDPMFQADFVEALLRECQNRGIDTAVETAGYGQWHQLEKISRYANLILYDIKCMDAVKHKLFTGVSNKIILRNLIRLAEYFPETSIVVRTPVIPGFNATTKDISMITKFIKSVKTVKDYQLLPYHRLGARKYGHLGKPHFYADASPPDEKCMQSLRAVANIPSTNVDPE
jgi:pyruvate formate lyase activating enzyme